MAFDGDRIVALVTSFCRRCRTDALTKFTVVASFADAARIVMMKGPDPRWKTIYARCDPVDAAGTAFASSTADRLLHDFLVKRELPTLRRNGNQRAPWFLRYMVVSARNWARFSTTLREAHDLGLGWLIPASREVLIVPQPTLRFAEGIPGMLHDDTGRPAVEWADGTGHYCLRGTEFGTTLYRKIIKSELSLDDVAAINDADQRSIALQYFTFERLVASAGAQLLDSGIKETRLYRLRLPPQLAADRAPGYGRYDYFIHMRDASHPQREFIEWVDPKIGRDHNAELCQAHAFGITLEDWLEISQEG